jgi:hypothetical protein
LAIDAHRVRNQIHLTLPHQLTLDPQGVVRSQLVQRIHRAKSQIRRSHSLTEQRVVEAFENAIDDTIKFITMRKARGVVDETRIRGEPGLL